MKAILLLLLFPGCIFISKDELDERMGQAGDTDDPLTGCAEADEETWWVDVDGDTYGDPAGAVKDCDQPAGTVANFDDCDDADPTVALLTDWMRDGDDDGYVDPDEQMQSCHPPDGYLPASDDPAAQDCDDGDPAVHPDAVETCDTPGDDNCDDVTEGIDLPGCTVYYADEDLDGFAGESAQCTCAPADPYLYTEITDCDDSDGTVSPDAEEVCNNGQDDTCDGSANDCVLTGPLDLSSADATFRGEAAQDWAGVAAAAVGDITGDGALDFAISAHKSNGSANDAGRVYLIDSASSGVVDLGPSAMPVIEGEGSGGQFGYSLAAGGDINGDGADDLVVGALLRGAGAARAGSAYVVFGPLAAPGSYLAASEGLRFDGIADGDQAGCAVAGGGDSNGDGQADLLVGAYKRSGTGGVWLFEGPLDEGGSLSGATASFSTGGTGDRTGFSVSFGGDMDGDGQDELLIGADRDDDVGLDSGALYVVSDPPAGASVLDGASNRLLGTAASVWAGYSSAPAGDVNEDGYADILVGGPAEAGETGVAWLVHGPVSGTVSLNDAEARMGGLSAMDRAGRSLSSAGDFNGDGSLDVAIGAPATDGTTPGVAALFYGPLSGSYTLSDAAVLFTGASTEDDAGQSIAAGDLDRDGVSDLIVTAPRAEGLVSDAGAAYLILGGGL